MQINEEDLKYDETPKASSISNDDLEFDEVGSNMEWKDVLGQAIKNIPHSAIETGKTMVQPFIHPVEAAKGLGRLAAGTVQKVVPGEQEYEKDVDALVDHFKGRYGSLDNFKQTLAKDPVGLTNDIASLFVPGGQAIKGLGVASKVGILSKTGKVISDVGSRMELQNLAKGAIAQPFKLLPESVPMKLYQSAAKFATSLPIKERDAITRTALKVENQIMPTVKGVTELKGKIDSFNEKVNELLSPQKLGFHKFDITGLRKGLDDLQDTMLQTTDQPIPVRNAFKNVYKNLDEAEKLGQMRTPMEVQKIKQNIYKELESFYEKHKATPAKVNVRKAVARNAREMLEDIVPEIKQLNKSEGELIELWDAIESKASRITNRDLIGIGLPMKVASGAAKGYALAGEIGAKIGTGLGLAHGILDSPIVKARMAIVLNRIKAQGIQVKPTQAGIRLGLYQLGEQQQGVQ